MKYVLDYRIHLIDPSRLTKEELRKFTTSFREVMECIKCSKDKEQMKELLHDNPRMQMEEHGTCVLRMARVNCNYGFDSSRRCGGSRYV
mgnify:CR=1 FL=1